MQEGEVWEWHPLAAACPYLGHLSVARARYRERIHP